MENQGIKVTYILSTIIAIFSCSDLLKCWRRTHLLDLCSPTSISGSDSLKHWRVTHLLDACLPIHINGSDLLKKKNWSETHKLRVHPFLSVVLIFLSFEENSHPEFMFTHLGPFLSVVLIKSNTGVTHFLDVCSPILVSGSDTEK